VAGRPRATWFFAPGSVITRGLVRLLGTLRVEGLEHVPRDGAFLLVGNHVSNFDPPTVGATVGNLTGRVIHFMSKEELRHWPLIGWLASQSGVFFVRRGEGDRAAHRTALAHLAAGRPVALFPEGHRSQTGIMREARQGAALLAIRSGAPLLPVGITGTHGIFPNHTHVPHRSDVTVRVGEPFHVVHRAEGRIPREELTAATETIMRHIAQLVPEWQRGPWAAADSGAAPEAERDPR
jgi:1-acyl-sn-glycerol-3-phosphate acyltransferase